MSVKSKHSISKRDKNSKKEKKKNLEESDEEIESSEEELDLTKECHPIGFYINDRAEMINQMFTVIRGNKLKAMLPTILKDCDIEQLKLQCLDQLLGMSEKRINCILEGGILETSSESDIVESHEYDSDEKNGTTSGSSSDESDNSKRNSNVNKSEIKTKKRKNESTNEIKGGKMTKSNEENAPPEKGKTLLEILELEMRARAIRALLKQSGTEKGNEQGNDNVNKNNIKEVEGEIVDLTDCKDDEFSHCVTKEKCEEKNVYDKVTSFETKVAKSKAEKKCTAKEDAKSKRLQAELELQNKLFKKKIYRTRQQRIENEEEDRINEINAEEMKDTKLSEIKNIDIITKKEPLEPEEVVIDDPEEGEISSSDDEYPVVIKQEMVESDVLKESQQLEQNKVNIEININKNIERVSVIDNETFVHNCNLEKRMDIDSDDVIEIEQSEDLPCLNEDVQQTVDKSEEKTSVLQDTKEAFKEVENMEETSWRDRWLKKDGVQRLVKSSKIYAKVKKRIAEKSQRAKEEAPTNLEKPANIEPQIEVIEGSIQEYERLLGKVQDKKENEIIENVNSQCSPTIIENKSSN